MRKVLIVMIVACWASLAGAYSMLLIDDGEAGGYVENMHWVATGPLTNWGYSFDHLYDNNTHRYTEDGGLLADYNIILWYNRGRPISETEKATLDAWVRGGRFLVVTGRDSLWNDPHLAELIYSSTYGDFLPGDRFVISNEHWITDGIGGYLEVGEIIDLLPSCYDNDDCNPLSSPSELPLTIAYLLIGEHGRGPSKIMVTENIGPHRGMTIYWNGNYQAQEWWKDLDSPKTWQMFRNMMDYLTSNVSSISYVSWGELKTAIE